MLIYLAPFLLLVFSGLWPSSGPWTLFFMVNHLAGPADNAGVVAPGTLCALAGWKATEGKSQGRKIKKQLEMCLRAWPICVWAITGKWTNGQNAKRLCDNKLNVILILDYSAKVVLCYRFHFLVSVSSYLFRKDGVAGARGVITRNHLDAKWEMYETEKIQFCQFASLRVCVRSFECVCVRMCVWLCVWTHQRICAIGNNSSIKRPIVDEH